MQRGRTGCERRCERRYERRCERRHERLPAYARPARARTTVVKALGLTLTAARLARAAIGGTASGVGAVRLALVIAGVAIAAFGHAAAPPRTCLSDCTPRIGIVSAFGQEAAILVGQTRGKRSYTVNGNRFTTGRLRGNRVVIVLSGVSMVNAAMTTQLLIDHFRVERLIMSGIAGGLNPAHRVGDVLIPDRWAMPLEVYWHADNAPPAPCGPGTDVSCLGLKLAQPDGRPLPPFSLPAPGVTDGVPTGLFVRESGVVNTATAPRGEFRFDYPVDAAMLAVARGMAPQLARCGPNAPAAATLARPAGSSAATSVDRPCVAQTPRVIVGGRGVSGTAFVANPAYRAYLFEQLGAQAVEMETAALAHVAYANAIPYIAFRSLSDLVGGQPFDADVAALFSSGLAEANEAAVTLAFLQAWTKRAERSGASRSRAGNRPS